MNTTNQTAPMPDDKPMPAGETRAAEAPGQELLELPVDILLHAFDALRDFEKDNDHSTGSGIYDYRRANILALLGIGFELRRIANSFEPLSGPLPGRVGGY